MKITAHTLIKNESRWIWYALMSVLEQVDEIMVWDTGSSDGTQDIVQSITSPKIKFRQKSIITPEDHSHLRQEMLDQTRSDWILILDGDEIWWWSSLEKTISAVRNRPSAAAAISPFINLVGDPYHYQPGRRASYQIHHYRGAFNLRFINRKLPGLQLVNPHGRQEYQTQGVPLQQLPLDRLIYVDAPYLHTTHLRRSTPEFDTVTLKRSFKYKYELGQNFGSDFTYPEVFYLPRPWLVPSPFYHRSAAYIATAAAYTPFRFAKHLVNSSPSGY